MARHSRITPVPSELQMPGPRSMTSQFPADDRPTLANLPDQTWTQPPMHGLRSGGSEAVG
jgi:hypothetical protein